MLRNSGGLSLLRGRPGVQVVVDNHTIDDSFWLHGWEATKRAQHGQGPISVQTYGSRTRRRLLTDMQTALVHLSFEPAISNSLQGVLHVGDTP